MSKAVLISIQPKWCELIASGKKTVEVRKNRPKIKTPFKVYIYCTKAPKGWVHIGKNLQLDTKVIGEFVCDDIFKIVKVGYTMREALQYRAVKDCTVLSDDIFAHSCLTKNEIEKYLDGRKGYAWHISELVIYDKPKELSELRAICRHYDDGLCGDCEYYYYANNESYRCEECLVDGLKPITRPPQSWCYVEERDSE